MSNDEIVKLVNNSKKDSLKPSNIISSALVEKDIQPCSSIGYSKSNFNIKERSRKIGLGSKNIDSFKSNTNAMYSQTLIDSLKKLEQSMRKSESSRSAILLHKQKISASLNNFNLDYSLLGKRNNSLGFVNKLEESRKRFCTQKVENVQI